LPSERLPFREHTFVPTFAYTVTEYDLDKPWLAISTSHHQVELDDTRSFHEWASSHWPAPRYMVQLDPWSDGSDFARS
jgi:hypothetical protein